MVSNRDHHPKRKQPLDGLLRIFTFTRVSKTFTQTSEAIPAELCISSLTRKLVGAPMFSRFGGLTVPRVPLLVFATALLCVGCGVKGKGNLSGTGSTFVEPVMVKWAEEYQKGKGSKITYESVGSPPG